MRPWKKQEEEEEGEKERSFRGRRERERRFLKRKTNVLGKERRVPQLFPSACH